MMTDVRLLAGTILGLAVSVAAVGQTTRPDAPPPAEDRTSDDALLAGPKVQSEQEQAGAISPSGRQRDRDAIPAGMWLRALGTLQLRPEQRREVDAVVGELREAQRAFTEAHGEELRALRQMRRRQRDGQGSPPPADLREKLQKIQANAPRPEPYQERIWEVLDEAQQEQFRSELDRIRQQLRERRNRQSDGMSQMTDEPDPPSAEADEDGAIDARSRRRGRFTLDDAGRRRLEFLRRHQRGDQPGTPLRPRERKFDFDE